MVDYDWLLSVGQRSQSHSVRLRPVYGSRAGGGHIEGSYPG
jgi:hypothetical protein